MSYLFFDLVDYKKLSLREIRKHVTPNKDVFVVFSNLMAPLFVKFFLYIPITANQVSLINFLLVFVNASLISTGNYWITFLGCFLLQLHIILDYSDGPIARLKKTSNSLLGEFHESLFHYFVPPVLMLALGVNSYMHFSNPFFIFLGGITSFLMLFAQQLSLSKDSLAFIYLRETGKRVLLEAKKKNEISSMQRKLNFVNSFSHIMGFLLILAILDVIHYAIIFYSIFYLVIAILKLYFEIKNGFSYYKFK